MNTNIRILILLFSILISSCQKREWNNPFDPECPKEIWTPTDFASVQQGNSINLTWVQAEKNISGFRLERKIEGETAWKEVVSPEKATNSWADQSITGGKLYEYRIVALAGGNESNFATVQIKPLLTATLTTAIPSSIKATSAMLGGTITTDGGATVTERGICWATTTAPTTDNNKLAISSGTGTFSSTISGLTTNTVYYIRAYAVNSQGIAYGNEITFKTWFGEVTDVDGNVYATVKIGNQIWMAENLKTTKYNDGTTIPNVIDNTAWASLTTGAYCWYNNDAATYKATYGALYNWYVVSTNKMAPTGWHVPTDADWTILTNYLGGASVAGGKLKETGTVHWLSPNIGATNESGFTAIPFAIRFENGSFRNPASNGYWGSGYWWSFNEVSATFASSIALLSAEVGIGVGATNNKLDGFSVRCIFGTLNPPTVTTAAISNLTTSSISCGGNITNDGGTAIIAHGVCWSTSPNPTIANSKTTDGTGSGSFTSILTGLAASTNYYVRAYATNGQGTAYGNEVNFKTLPGGTAGTVTDIDGNVYNTVTIGTQTWMVENLKTTKYNDGTAVPNVTDNTAWINLVTPGYCWYKNDATSYKNTYGALYNWYAVNTGKLAPAGWHVPSDAEWTTLTSYLGGESVAGGKLKETGISHWLSPNTGATNESGFTALPGGMRFFNDGVFGSDSGFGGGGYWWSSTENITSNAWSLGLFASSIGIANKGNGNRKQNGFSVRCIKD